MSQKKFKAEDYAGLNDIERCFFIGALMNKRWRKIARPEQIPGAHADDEDYVCHFFQAGRGTGKTRSAAEWIAAKCLTRPNTYAGILAPTFDAGIKVCIFGESGIANVIPDKSLFKWNEVKKQITFTNGSVITCYSSEHIRQMRGPQFHYLWIDEPADLSYGMDCWEIARPAVRLRIDPSKNIPSKIFVTGTPKPVPLIIQLVDLNNADSSKYTRSRGRTKDNYKNLDPSMVEELELLKGTRYYEQEIEGELITQARGALWDSVTVIGCRTEMQLKDQYDFEEIIIAVDPAVSSDKNADETGIIVAGRGADGDCYIIADYSRRASALDWSRLVVSLCDKHGATSIVYERNLAGPLLEDVMRKTLDELGKDIRLIPITAKKKKMIRAEPVAAMYQAGHVKHVTWKQENNTKYMQYPDLERLENQMTTWEPTDSKSPDRIDALVHAVNHLVINKRGLSIYRPGRLAPIERNYGGMNPRTY